MPFYEIKYSSYGYALIEADNEDQAIEFLTQEVNWDEAEVETVLEEKPTSTLYDVISLEK